MNPITIIQNLRSRYRGALRRILERNSVEFGLRMEIMTTIKEIKLFRKEMLIWFHMEGYGYQILIWLKDSETVGPWRCLKRIYFIVAGVEAILTTLFIKSPNFELEFSNLLNFSWFNCKIYIYIHKK